MEYKVSEGKPIKNSLKEYSRGMAGGLIFSLPLLYTMEVWWAGFITTPLPLLAMVVFTFFLLLGYNRFSGVRKDQSWQEIAIDSTEELGLGFIISFLILLMLDRVNPQQMHFNEFLGKLVIEAMAVSIGISIGKEELGSSSEKNENKKKQNHPKQEQSNEEAGKEEEGEKGRNTLWGMITLSVCGSVIIASNVAPTQEIVLLGVEAEPINILVTALVSIVISVLIVYFSDFRGAPKRSKSNKTFNMVLGTSISYLAALATSAFLLWFFGRFEHLGLWPCVAQVIVLGFPATLGASAGRLLIR